MLSFLVNFFLLYLTECNIVTIEPNKKKETQDYTIGPPSISPGLGVGTFQKRKSHVVADRHDAARHEWLHPH